MLKRICTYVIAVLTISGCGQVSPNRDILFQQSTIEALLKANYESDMTFGELKKYGDFGIGTFGGLDGEMLAYDSVFFQVKSDGKVYPVSDSMTSPFAAVSFFEPDIEYFIEKITDYAALINTIDSWLPTENIFYAIKVEGLFSEIKVRSVPKQEKPYPPLIEVVKSQPVFTYTDVHGILIGFRCPGYVKGINVPGYHFHFIDQDKKNGGHVLACSIQDAVIQIDPTHGFSMALPRNAQFYQTPLGQDQSSALKKVEK